MQRPIILTAKHRMYGDTFDMAQTHEQVYECVQPLQAGRLTFVPGKPDNKYVNNLSLNKHAYEEKPTFVIFSWDTIIWILIAFVSVGCMVMTFDNKQTAFNDVYLTQFAYDINKPHQYSLQYAGKILPLPYMIAALTCFCCSIIVGWQSNSGIRLNLGLSWFVVGLIFILQVWGLVLHIWAAVNGFDGNYIMLSVGSVLGLHIATTIITLIVVLWYQGYKIKDETATTTADDEKQHATANAGDATKMFEPTSADGQKTSSMFWLTVAEDLNLIAAYALVVTALNALASVHDDTTVFFDVVCVVMIGFLQHIANVLMIFHRHIVIESTPADDADVPKIVNVIARSRLLIFFLIGAVVVFFYLRISPTYQAFTLGIPYEILRVLAVITMVSMGTFHSIWYEFRHADNGPAPKEWETSPTWKLVTGAFIVLLFSAFLWRNAILESDDKIKHYLIHGQIKVS